MELIWSPQAWADYLWWQETDRRVLRRINALVQNISRNGNLGIGKPETLRHEFTGYWSRRITDEHRLIYRYAEDKILIAECRFHYGR